MSQKNLFQPIEKETKSLKGIEYGIFQIIFNGASQLGETEMQDNKTIRLGLNAKGSKALYEMMNTLKSECQAITLSPSSLASIVIERYLKKGQFKKDMKALEREFFNEKKFLREAMKSGVDLKETIQKLNLNYKYKKIVQGKASSHE